MGARLGPYNLALVACYTAPTWGAEAIKALTSPYGGLIDPVHAAAAVRLRAILNLPPEQLLDVANCCLLYTSPSPRDGLLSRMPSSA